MKEIDHWLGFSTIIHRHWVYRLPAVLLAALVLALYAWFGEVSILTPSVLIFLLLAALGLTLWG
jgi:hypothetical protein